MDPNTKLILDELKSVQTNLTNRIGAVESSIGARVEFLEGVAQVFGTWRPQMEATVEELRAEMGAIRTTETTVETLREEMTALRKSVSRTVLDATSTMPTGVLPSFPCGDRDEGSRWGHCVPPVRARRGIKPPGIGVSSSIPGQG
jgi:hypothetical protein